MSWDPNFIQDLSDSSVQPKFFLRFNKLPNFVGDTLVISGGYNQIGVPSITDRGPIIRGTSVIPQTWNISFGSFSVPLCGDVRSLFPTIRKGSVAELYAELNGNVERIAIGQLRNIRGFGENWTLEFVDLITAMTARADGRIGTAFDGNDPDKFTLFYNVGKTVTTTANWFATGTNFPTSISVDDVRPFEVETGQTGVAHCVDVGGGNEFFIKYSSTSITSSPAGTLNLASVHTTSTHIYPSVNPCANLNTGSSITSRAVLQGKPFEIFGKILLSRNGAGVNTLDKYPTSYNFGAFLNENIFDRGDAANQDYIKSSDPSGTDYAWRFIVDQPMTNGIRNFIDTAALCGQWPTWRQDSVTWRGCQDPDQAQSIQAYITTKDIIDINSIDMFDPNNKSTFYRSKNIYGINSTSTILSNSRSQTTGEAQHLPAQSFKQRDLRFVYEYNPNSAPTDRLKCSLGDLNRLFVWDTHCWSKISLQVKMKYAKLTAGDIIEVKSKFLRTYSNSNIKDVVHRAMVLSVDWNFLSSRCNLQIAILLK
jgi:hypothetical protein